MTLYELLRAVENVRYKKSHTYNIPARLFEKSIQEIEFIDVKSKGYIKVLMGVPTVCYSPAALLSIPVEDKGSWVCELAEGWVLLYNYISKRQAVQAIENRENAFVMNIKNGIKDRVW